MKLQKQYELVVELTAAGGSGGNESTSSVPVALHPSFSFSDPADPIEIAKQQQLDLQRKLNWKKQKISFLERQQTEAKAENEVCSGPSSSYVCQRFGSP